MREDAAVSDLAVAAPPVDEKPAAKQWRTFATVDDAHVYADECWARYLSDNDDGRVRVKVDKGETALTLLGVDDDGKVSRDGVTTAWDVPRPTAESQWAVQCPNGDKGEPEPKWLVTIDEKANA